MSGTNQSPIEKVFSTDVLSKRERVERTLALQPVDRVVLHEQLSYNPSVIALYTNRTVHGFDYTYEEICAVIRQTLDACFPPLAPQGIARVTDRDGYVLQHDNWTTWTVSRPFGDVAGAREYLQRKTEEMLNEPFDAERERERYHRSMRYLQSLIGETVVIDYPVGTGFCDCWSKLGMELFTYLYVDEPQVVTDYVEAATETSIRRLHAIADPTLSPVVLIAEDFATKQGPIFSPALLRQEHYPRVRRVCEAWHSHGLKVLYHSDGNWKSAIPDLVACGLDGFYCLEPSVGMEVVALKRAWPRHTWAGGVDGVDLMERGTPEQVTAEVRRQILETDALHTGGLFIASSSEINPPIKAENFRAMVAAVGTVLNPGFARRAEEAS